MRSSLQGSRDAWTRAPPTSRGQRRTTGWTGYLRLDRALCSLEMMERDGEKVRESGVESHHWKSAFEVPPYSDPEWATLPRIFLGGTDHGNDEEGDGHTLTPIQQSCRESTTTLQHAPSQRSRVVLCCLQTLLTSEDHD